MAENFSEFNQILEKLTILEMSSPKLLAAQILQSATTVLFIKTAASALALLLLSVLFLLKFRRLLIALKPKQTGKLSDTTILINNLDTNQIR